VSALRFGDRGARVQELQRLLVHAGNQFVVVDGVFGAQTEAAVKQFQREHGLVSDGIVGPLTLNQLECSDQENYLDSTEHDTAVGLGFAIFPKQHHRNVLLHAPLVATAMRRVELHDPPMLLYATATIAVETGDYTPKSELISKYNTTPGGRPFGKYDFRRDLGNHSVGAGEATRGRGFIQLTGTANYVAVGKRIGISLIQDPERANEPSVAAAVLADFLKQSEPRIRTALRKPSLTREERLAALRRIVNGGTHGLREFSTAYTRGEQYLESM
jgi:peptidoglycan L-alanyl-D-glutamate endopeptidase CwlK